MNSVYDIYEHPTKGAWGVSVQNISVSTASVVHGCVTEGSLKPHLLAPEVSKRIRLGFKKLARRKYLHLGEIVDGKQHGEFADKHPELIVESGLIFFTPLVESDDLMTLCQQWENALERSDARPEHIEQWIKRIGRSRHYLVATASHPAIPLVLADWAKSGNRMLVCESSGMPDRLPKESPIEWERWLTPFFKNPNEIRNALEHFGWSARHAMMAPLTELTETTDEAGGWLADASSVAF